MRYASGSLNELELQLQRDLFADHHSTGLERGIEIEAKILADNFCRCLDADAGVTPGVLYRWGRALDGELHFVGGAVNGQRTGHCESTVGFARDAGRAE